jgi:hypothetical protein
MDSSLILRAAILITQKEKMLWKAIRDEKIKRVFE